jgi:hypothetical protein
MGAVWQSAGPFRLAAMRRSDEGTDQAMFRNTMRGMLALLLTFMANWLADWIMDRVFGPQEAEPAKR